jgi:hypothetical protein
MLFIAYKLQIPYQRTPKKNVALRALLSLKPANISAFCLYDRAAGRLLLLLCAVRSALYTARVSCCMCPCPVLRRCRRALSIGRLPLPTSYHKSVFSAM